MKNLVLFLGATMLALFIIVGCCQNSNKQKELDLKEKELALRERELALKEKDTTISIQKQKVLPYQEVTSTATQSKKSNTTQTNEIEKKCDSKYQITGKLIGVFNYGYPCAYAYIEILNDEGKTLNLFLEGNLDNFKINNQKFFKWSNNKIDNFLENDKSSSGQFPNDVFDVSFLNKKYFFCCYKEQLACGDDPNSPKQYFCKQILSQLN